MLNTKLNSKRHMYPKATFQEGIEYCAMAISSRKHLKVRGNNSFVFSNSDRFYLLQGEFSPASPNLWRF